MTVDVALSGPRPELVEGLLATLPKWFGLPEANRAYVEDARRLPTFVARADGADAGVLLLRRHFPESAEIQLMAVDPDLHRRGVGRALVDAAAQQLQADGVRILSVKTSGPSFADEPYARTRAFYLACGFVPVEEFADLWPSNPCLLLVKPISR